MIFPWFMTQESHTCRQCVKMLVLGLQLHAYLIEAAPPQVLFAEETMVGIPQHFPGPDLLQERFRKAGTPDDGHFCGVWRACFGSTVK